MRRVIVTGGAGFIGSAVARRLIARGDTRVVVLDKLTYAASLDALESVRRDPNFELVVGDIGDRALVSRLLRDERIDAIMHLAAESHVDRSIDGPGEFIETNIVGTFQLLQAALEHWRGQEGAAKDRFRFHHVSTDEVFGDLPFDETRFTESSPYKPSSPYSASKAASDHLVRAWHETYGLPVIVSNCSNNYGPFQAPEKLIPLTILNAISGRELPVYGTGANVRDWLHVEDHARALDMILHQGVIGETYVVGGREEHSNVAVVAAICDLIDTKMPLSNSSARRSLIRFVADRPGHDRRYAIDPSRIETELGWSASYGFKRGLEATVDWYIANERWWSGRSSLARKRAGLTA